MNIAEKTIELMQVLKTTGINDVLLPDITPESKDEWNKDYAIIQDVGPDIDYEFYNDRHEADFYYDLKNFCQNFYGPDVIVEIHQRSREIEIYTKGYA